MTDITPTTAPAAAPAPTLASETAPAAAPEAASRATFDVLPLSREVRETLVEMGYTHPTPVQIAVWEPATRGKDAVVQARTGTGKTAAFGLPIVDHLVRRSVPHVQVLALCPTRELALQVATEVEKLGKRRNVKITAIYGGAPMQRQIDQIADGAQVIVGTPGRVLDHLRRGTLDPRHVRMLVLDEADEMLSMGFEREVTAILDTLPKDRQTLLFSATVPPDIERMAKKLRTPEFLTLSGDHVGALEIEHFVYMVASDKMAALVRVLEVENPESAVIFCNTKDETERVAQTLARQGYDADWLNGDLPQSDREKVMKATREGRLRFLVATDVAARGIDISHLTHVINHDFPQDAESYVHRTGRTGRAGRTGTAVSLITPHDVGGLYLLRLTYKIRPIEKQIPTEGELKTRGEADLVTMLVEAFTSGGVHPDDLALARRLLTHEQCDIIFAGLLRDHLGARPTAKHDAATARRATRAPAPPPPPRPAPAPAKLPEREARPSPAAARDDAKPPAVALGPSVTTGPSVVIGGTRPAGRLDEGGSAPRPASLPAPTHEASPRQAAGHESGPRAQAAGHEGGPRAQGGFRSQAAGQEGGFRSQAAGHEGGFRSQPGGHDAGSRPHAPGAELPRPEHRPDPRDERRGRDARSDEGGNASRPPQERRDRDENRRAPRPAPEGPLPRRPRRADHVPVSAAQGTHEGTADPRNPPQRHADFTTWQPPEEEGDDEPILGAGHDVPSAPDPRANPRDRSRRAQPFQGAPFAQQASPAPAAVARSGDEGAPAGGDDADFAEIYVNVGRRDGARAADYQHILTEKAGLDRAHVRRIRVRERNAFVSVRREDLARALAALSGASLAGKVAMAEQARERGSDDAAAPPMEAATPSPDAPRAASLPREGEAPSHASLPTTEPAAAEAAAPADQAPAVPPAPVSSDDAVPTGRSGT